jgi:hypothetical protein
MHLAAGDPVKAMVRIHELEAFAELLEEPPILRQCAGAHDQRQAATAAATGRCMASG